MQSEEYSSDCMPTADVSLLPQAALVSMSLCNKGVETGELRNGARTVHIWQFAPVIASCVHALGACLQVQTVGAMSAGRGECLVL